MKQLSNGIEIPTSWSEIYLDQFIDLRKIDSNLSVFERQIEILSILTETLPSEGIWDDMDVDEFSDLMVELKWLRSEPTTNLAKELGPFKLKKIHTISNGEYLDLQFFTKENMFDNLPKICAILYRKHITDEYGNVQLEPYSAFDLDERSEMFVNLTIDKIYGVLDYFFKFKEHFINSYQNVLTGGEAEEDEDDGYTPTPEEAEEIKREIIAENWAWEKLFYDLADGDLTKFNAVTDLGLIFTFNMISMKKSLRL